MFRKFRYIVLVTIGTALLAFAVYAFAIPNDLIFGGATGLSLTINHFTGIGIPVITAVFNVLFLLMGWFLISKEIVIGSVLSSLIYPLFLDIFEKIPQLATLCNDPVVASVMGGLCAGAGIGMVLSVGASTGGTDILCVLLHDWMKISVGTALNVTDFIIMLSQLTFQPVNSVFYGIIYTICTSIAIDKVMLIGNQKVKVSVISDHYEEIRRALLEADVGVTMYEIKTGLDQKEEESVVTVINKKYLTKVEKIIRDADPASFSSVEEINEVHGRGFTLEKYAKPLDFAESPRQ